MLTKEVESLVRDADLSDDLKKLILEDHLRRESESRSQIQPGGRRLLANGPFLAAAASVGAALLSGVFAYGSVVSKSASDQSLERQKFEFELVKIALDENKSPEERKKGLTFFQSVGLFRDLRISDVVAEDLPALSSAIEGVFTIENLYPETAATIGLILTEPQISPEEKTWKKFWHLYRVDLIGVESREVAIAMVNFGRELTKLAEGESPPNEELRRLGVAVIEAMALELPAIEAFKEKIAE